MHKVSNLSDLKELAIAEDFKNYAYIVSHDLGAPVRAMVEFSKLLKNECEGSLSEDGKEYLSFIVESGQNLQAMMNGLLSLSRISTVDTALSKIDIHEIVNEFCKSNNCSISCDALPQPVGEESLIKKLFFEILDNAFKFHKDREKSDVKIIVTDKFEFYEFAIHDNGIGIAPKFQEAIFKPFKRLHTDDEYSGIGMGLTLAEKIVHKHGGKIYCNSSLGQGSIFVFTLPADILTN